MLLFIKKVKTYQIVNKKNDDKFCKVGTAMECRLLALDLLQHSSKEQMKLQKIAE